MPDATSAIAAERRRAAAIAGHTGDADVARTLLTDSDPSVRATAFAALDRCGALGGAALRAGLDDADGGVRRRCATIAAHAHERAVVAPALLGRLSDDDHLVAEAAAWAFGEWGADNPSADLVLPALVAMATDHGEPLCREAAVAALGAIGDERGRGAILARLYRQARGASPRRTGARTIRGSRCRSRDRHRVG